MTTMPVSMQHRIPIPSQATRPQQPAVALSLSDVFRILMQRMFLIIFIFLFIVGSAVGLTFWLQQNHPRYTSRAAVQVESPFAKDPFAFTERPLQGDLMNRYVSDQIFLLRDEGLLREVLNDSEVMATQWYRSEENKTLLLQELSRNLGVGQAPNASIIVISFSTKVPEDAPRIVNAIVRLYLARVQDMSFQRYAGELFKVQEQEGDLSRQIQQIRNEKETFITSHLGAPGLTSGLNVSGEMWRSLALQTAELEAYQLQLKAAFDNLRGLDPSQVTLSPQMVQLIEQDPQVVSLQQTLLNLRNYEMSLIRQVGPNHTSLQQLRNQIDSTEKSLDQVRQRKREEARQYQVNSAEAAWLNALQAQIQLQERVDAAKAEQRDVDRKLAQYQMLEEQQHLLEEKYRRVSDQINALQMVTRDRQDVVRVNRISQAVPALQPSFPRWRHNIPAGVLLGLLAGVGLAILLEVVDTSIKTTRDISRHAHIPILGTVPDIDDEELPIDVVELAAYTAPRSMVAEAFRSIRTNLLLSAPAERQRALLVTSAKPEEGKSAVSINLAISLAQNNRRVLLVDANFHRPVLRNFFKKTRAEGLSQILIGQGAFEEYVSNTELPNLDVLGSGPVPPNPSELLAGSYMRDFIQQASERYDQIIFDGPPVLLFSDAMVLAGATDGVILVCRAKATSRGVVQRARDMLERANVRIFGGVLNAAQVTRGGYFREQIRSYYDYQPAESLAQQAPPALLTKNGSGSDEPDDDANDTKQDNA